MTIQVINGQDKMTQIIDIVYVYWPCIMAMFVVGIGACYDVSRSEQLWPVPLNCSNAIELLTSSILLISTTSAIIGLYLANKATKSFTHKFSKTERMCMTWHLMNACFYHTLCDAFSGLFAITPKLREAYTVQNQIHKLERYHPDRVVWDTVYWFELLVETPFALLVFYLYLRQSKIRYTVEAFLHGMHFAGAVAYYIPDLILGHTPHVVISNLDRLIACCWIIIPFCMLARTIKMVANDQVKQGILIVKKTE